MPKLENCFVKGDIGYWLVSGSNRGPNIPVSTIYLYYIYIYIIIFDNIYIYIYIYIYNKIIVTYKIMLKVPAYCIVLGMFSKIWFM